MSFKKIFFEPHLKPKLKTGIFVLDYQHEMLFDLFAKLEQASKYQDDLYDMLIDISNYMHTHFQTEEDFMRYIDYPRYEQHKNTHDVFILEYKKIIEKSIKKNNLVELRQDLKDFLSMWFNYHYNEACDQEENDLTLIRYINENKRP